MSLASRRTSTQSTKSRSESNLFHDNTVGGAIQSPHPIGGVASSALWWPSMTQIKLHHQDGVADTAQPFEKDLLAGLVEGML